MEQLIAFLTGSCLASFIVTMTQRHLLEMGHSSPRSLCDHCTHPLAWWQLIPLVGFALQLGRCRWCKKNIAPWSSVCELTCGTWLALYNPLDLTEWLASLVLLTGLSAMATTDWYAGWMNPLALTSLLPLHLIALSPLGIEQPALFLLVAGLLSLITLLSHGLGLGDLEWLLVVLILAGWQCYWQTLLIGCGLALTSPKLWHRQPLPFLPYLSTGLLVSLLI